MAEIKAKKNDVEVTIEYDFKGNLEGAVEAFGEEVVYSGFVSKSVITAQAAMRRYIETGKDEDEIQELMNGWKPGVALKGESDPVGALVRKAKAMEPDARAEFIAELEARLAQA
jgi:hypothetical protein